jgi:predicted TIM-barrel fold metal-dependent hydrolase
MWGSDYPHQDSSFPNSARIVAEHFAGVPLEDQMRIGRQNAIDLYNLPLQ